MQRDLFNLNNVYKLSVSQSNAVKLSKQLINMQSDKGDILSHDDDQAPILIISNIFKKTPLLSKIQENLLIKHQEINYLCQTQVNLWINNQQASRIQLYQSLLNLSVPRFSKCNAIKRIYIYEAELLYFKLKDRILFYLDILKKTKMKRNEKSMFLDSFLMESFSRYFRKQRIFQILYTPQIQNLFNKWSIIKQIGFNNTYHNKKIKLNSIHLLNRVQNNLAQVQEVAVMNIIEFGQMENNSKQVDLLKKIKRFKVGPYDIRIIQCLIIQDEIHLLNIDLIEVWNLKFSNLVQGTSYFKTTYQIHFGQDEQSINQNQLRVLIITLNQQQGRNDYISFKFIAFRGKMIYLYSLLLILVFEISSFQFIFGNYS
ncbi:unnamed protein product [Paramecium sonneborni]|uniref:Transmembrane protein n=1 Tax=Paramecium sonneborni TaxID=65129 RepID=A0A8S1NTJ7_9CILI|nr:unnamed protein product [Paramecium sonneborni]